MSMETGFPPPSSYPAGRSLLPVGPMDGGGHGAPTSSAMDALAAAREQYRSPTERGIRSAAPRVRLWWLVAAAVTGSLPAFLAPPEYATRATLRIQGPQAVEHAAVYRRALLDFTWRHLAESKSTDRPVQWSVETPQPDSLALHIRCSDGRRALHVSRELAQGFVQTMRQESEAVSSAPSPPEVLLSGYASELQNRLAAAETQMGAFTGADSNRTPMAEYETMTARWASARADFQTLRQHLINATDDLQRLRAAGEPSHGLVSAEDHHQAMERDLTLQQDLKELHVFLTELKLHLLTVWKESASALEALTGETERLRAVMETVESAPDAKNAAVAREREEDSLATTQRWYEEVTAFAAAWRKEFSLLRQLEADPLAGEIIDVHEHTRDLLNKFLFNGGQRLSKLRAQLWESDADGGNDARHHVRHSELLHAFHVVQAAHHRFEFSAGALETRSNFQMDTALRGATGLRRRSQHQIRAIDERLERQATDLARKSYREALAVANANWDELRSRADRLVEELVSLQESLNVQAGLSAEFLRASLSAQRAEREADLAKSDLTRVREHQQTLEDQRRATFGDTSLTVVDVGLIPDWTTTWRRARVALAGSLVAVGAVLGGQWLVRRQTRRWESA